MSTRLDEFVEFHKYCCWNDSIVVQLKAYADICGLSTEQREWLVFFYSLSYSIPTAVICLENFDKINADPDEFWYKFKPGLVFQSDRRWVKFNNQFAKSFNDFKRKRIFEQLRGNGAIDVGKSIALIQSVSYYARFAAFLFLEAYCFMFQRTTINDCMDWKKGDTATSGMLNALGLDNHANEFDRSGRLFVSEQVLDSALAHVQARTTTGLEKSVLFIETTLCAYRKHFKGTRYVGYYVDRVQQEVELTKKAFPMYAGILNRIYDARISVLNPGLLGECNGWHGVRKKLLKHYLKTGDWRV